MGRTKNPFYGITINEIAELCQVDLTTARRWKRGARCPPKSAVLLISRDLGIFDSEWRGWMVKSGNLVSPEGWEIKMGEVLAVPLMRQQIAVYQAEVRRLLTGLSIQEQPKPDEFPHWIAELSA